jgi:uncharacterized protein YqfA (UPF0365 family)
VTPTLIDIAVMFAINYLIFFVFIPTGLWIRAMSSGVSIPLLRLIAMRLRRSPPYLIVPALIKIRKAGYTDVSLDQLETHFLAGGNPEHVVNALIASRKAGRNLTFQEASQLDLMQPNDAKAFLAQQP